MTIVCDVMACLECGMPELEPEIWTLQEIADSTNYSCDEIKVAISELRIRFKINIQSKDGGYLLVDDGLI